MSAIRYVQGDATRPQCGGHKIIAHCCNDLGAWGAGFVLALSARWPEPEAAYRSLKMRFLGDVQFVEVEPDITVANIIGQRGITRIAGVAPIRYPALASAFRTIAARAKTERASIHMPRIGCGLAGGRWSLVEGIINNEFGKTNIPVTVYDLPEKR